MKKLIILLLLLPFPIKAIEASTFSSSGECTILMDMDSKRIMYASNIHKTRSIASITNIMTT